VVVPAAIRGLSDPDPSVRRACVNAVRQVSLSLREMIPNVELRPEYINLGTISSSNPLPPTGREWTDRERAHVAEARREVRGLNEELDRGLPEFQKNALALTRATADADPEVRIVGLKRPREEVVASFSRFLDEYNLFPTNHWAEEPAVGWFHEPLWTLSFPQYPIADRAAGIQRYWDEYYRQLGGLARRYPRNVRVFDMQEVLNTEAGQRDVLAFAGYPAEQQVLAVCTRAHRVKPAPQRPPARRTSSASSTEESAGRCNDCKWLSVRN